MATFSVIQAARTATGTSVPGTAASGGGDEFANTGREALLVTNGSGGDITVTAVTQQTVDGLAVADMAVVVPAGEARILGPWPTGTYNDGDGMVQITYSGVSSLTVDLLRIA